MLSPLFDTETFSVEIDDLIPGTGISRPDLLDRRSFEETLYRERRRTDRSRRPFVLMILESADIFGEPDNLTQVLLALSKCTRETDAIGWYREGSAIGILFTEFGEAEKSLIVGTLPKKARQALQESFGTDLSDAVRMSLHWYPGESGEESESSCALYPERNSKKPPKRVALSLKRAIDVVGSLAALIFLSPILLVIAVVVKFTSKGPVLFKQVRIGHYGEKFTFLKFRSMYDKNDSKIHEDYVRQLITGSVDSARQNGRPDSPYKLVADPRITTVGRFLRRTSLDELPQFFHVLRGEMSLVGPRPPVPYEFENYDVWHRRRLVDAKPGITGLWQVRGRSRTTFDDMVRLDLKYASAWSLWLDIRILLATPKAVLSGAGAG